jgi:hypothetical protein
MKFWVCMHVTASATARYLCIYNGHIIPVQNLKVVMQSLSLFWNDIGLSTSWSWICWICPGVRLPSGTRDQFFFLLETSFRQLRVCYFVAPSLTRGRVCNLLYNCFWALPEQSLFSRSPSELTAIFYCLIWDCRARFLYLYPPGAG